MIFSRDWLGQYVQLPAEVEELAEALTRVGLAVEGLEQAGEDVLLDVDVTTNRPDCMNHLGLAREVAVAFGEALRLPTPQIEAVEDASAAQVRVEIQAPELCRRFTARVVRGVRIGPSPGWLQARLAAIGLRPINNVVDVTNFVLWELGQPLHAYDLETLRGGMIGVRGAKAGERLVTLDGEERSLSEGIPVIVDGERAVGLAGVMGGLDTEVTGGTRDLLIESAWFEPGPIRRASRELGLHTDASHRFERGADRDLCLLGSGRAASLIVELAGGEVLAPAVDARQPEEPVPAIVLSHRRLEGFAGVAVPAEEVERILSGLGFGVRRRNDTSWEVETPSWRRLDIEEEADLFEEVLRHQGFDAIPSALPALAGPDGPELEAHRIRRRVQSYLAGCGFAEAIDYAFHSEEDDRGWPALVAGEPLRLDNPLSERYAVMRRSLLPGLVGSARYNRRRNLSQVRLFEVGHVFWRDETGPGEREHVAVVAGGGSEIPWQGAGEVGFFDLKGVMEGLMELLGRPIEARPAELPGLVEGATAELWAVDGTGPVGVLGRVAEEPAAYPLWVGELSLAEGISVPGARPVRMPSRFPGVAMDLTLTHAVEVPWSEIAHQVEAQGVPDLVEYGLKDRYTGEGVPAGAVNTTLFFRYHAEDRSLTQEEVNDRHHRLAARLEERLGWPEQGGSR